MAHDAGLGKTATVVTTQLTSIYDALKGKDGLATSKLGDAIHALDLKYAPPPGSTHPQEAAATFLTELALDPSQALDAEAFIGAASILRPEAIKAAAGPRNAKRLQKKMRADPFAIMRRKQSRAQAFDFKKEAETGRALAHVQRLQEDIQAQQQMAPQMALQQYYNTIAPIGFGMPVNTTNIQRPDPNPITSAAGGAMSGAALGSMFGMPGMGAAIGGGFGLLGGLL